MAPILDGLEALPWFPVILVAIVLGLAPFRPEPHLFQKIRMLRAGTLTRPLDIFDLCLHAAPIALLIVKALAHLRA